MTLGHCRARSLPESCWRWNLMPTGEFLPLRCQNDGRFHSLTHSLRFSRYRVVCVCPFQPTSWWFASLKTARPPITHCRRTSTTWSTRRWGCRRCRYCKVRDIFQTFFQVGKATYLKGRAYGRVETVWSFSNLFWLNHQAVFVDKEAAVKRVVGSSALPFRRRDDETQRSKRDQNAESFEGLFLNYDGIKASYKARVQLEVSNDFPSKPSARSAGTWCIVSISCGQKLCQKGHGTSSKLGAQS